MSDIPNGVSIRELRMLLDEAESNLGVSPEIIPVVVEAKGSKKPLKLTGDFDVEYGMAIFKAK